MPRRRTAGPVGVRTLRRRRGVSGLSAVLTLVLFGATPTFARAAEGACRLEQLAELPVEISGRRIILPAKIDGAPVRMIVDTGASYTLLTPPAVSKLKVTALDLRGVQFYGVGGASGARLARVDFEMGGARMRDFGMLVTGHGALDADGAVGASYLLQTDIEFDLPDGKVRFLRSSQTNGIMPGVRHLRCGSPIRFTPATVSWSRLLGDNTMAALNISLFASLTPPWPCCRPG